MLRKKLKTNMKFKRMYLLAVIILGISIASTMLVVYADTDGNELRITAQPDKLVLNLGSEWAGTEFELRLDSGVFPVPVKVSSVGVLTMELGGSKTYTLTLVNSIPAAEPSESSHVPAGSEKSDAEIIGSEQTNIIVEPEVSDSSIPLIPMIIFLSGLILAVTGLLVMRAVKRRREYCENDDGDEYDEE
jgi:hypothetical protein